MFDNLTIVEKTALETIAQGDNKALAKRAKIILLSTTDETVEAIANQVGYVSRTVVRWRQQFKEKRLGIFPEAVIKSLTAELTSSSTDAPKEAVEVEIVIGVMEDIQETEAILEKTSSEPEASEPLESAIESPLANLNHEESALLNDVEKTDSTKTKMESEPETIALAVNEPTTKKRKTKGKKDKEKTKTNSKDKGKDKKKAKKKKKAKQKVGKKVKKQKKVDQKSTKKKKKGKTKKSKGKTD